MRRISIQAEISARSYKKLCEKLKGFNKKQLWKVLDHYIFHTMDDNHVNELLQILEGFEKTDSFNEPHEATGQFTLPTQDTVYQPPRKMSFSDVILEKDIKQSRDRLDLMYDVTYFTRLTAEAAAENARRLIAYAEREDLPTQPHWHLAAIGVDFYEEESGE